MKLLKNKKSFTLGWEQIIIILILLFFLIALIVWYVHLKGQGSSALTDFFRR